MKPKGRLFSRRRKERSAHPKPNQTSPSRSEDEEVTIDTAETLPRASSCQGEGQGSPERKTSSQLDGITEAIHSFSSSSSGETTASDRMKCLNALRIQNVSATNSTPTPSVASIPRLAPPPLGGRDSSQQGTTDDVLSSTSPMLNGSRSVHGKDRLESETPAGTGGRDVGWVAFVPDQQEEKCPEGAVSTSKSVFVHASSSGVEASNHRVVPTETPKTEAEDTAHSTSSRPRPEEDPAKWNAFEEEAFPSSSSVQPPEHGPSKAEPHPGQSTQGEQEVVSPKPLRAAPKPPINPTPDAAVPRSPWVDSDEDDAPVFKGTTSDNPFAAVDLKKRMSSSCSLASKGGDVLLQSVLTKHGTPKLELVETVNAYYSGNRLTRYSTWGDVKFKLSGMTSLSTESDPYLSSRAVECMETYRLVLRLKCILQHVYLKHVIAKKALMEWEGLQEGAPSRQSSLTMNEARKGVVESKLMYWNLARCYQEALSSPVTLLRYPVQPNSNTGPPLKVQIQWQRPKKIGQPILVDVTLMPNRQLATSLWGVTVCLKGFGTSGEGSAGVEAVASPQARWNPADCTFEWTIPVIHPNDAVQHLRVKVTDKSAAETYPISAAVRFVMPHATLSGTVLLGWLERKDLSPTEPLFGEESTKPEPDLIFCEKMCLSGSYGADVNYGSK